MNSPRFPTLRVAAALGLANAAIATVALAAAPWLQNDHDSASLNRAHSAYLAGDLKAMGSSIKDVLADDSIDPVEKENALKLMSKAFDDRCGSMPADWHLPAGVVTAKFGHTRKQQSDGVFYKAGISGSMVAPDTVAGLRLRHYPNEILLDSKAGLGEWETGLDTDDGSYYFSLDSKKDMADPLADGLYFIDFEMKDGSTTTGWFVLSDLTSTESPNLLSPANGEHLHTATPTFAWEDFRSPEYKPCEVRTVAIGVTQLVDQAPGWIDAWEYWVRDPIATTAVVGQLAGGARGGALSNGRYWTTLTFWEERRFGDLRLRRGSRTSRNIYVDGLAK